MTKKDTCKQVIREFITSNGIAPKDIDVDTFIERIKLGCTELNDKDILKSLAVAMEYLGLLRDRWAVDYAASRSGVLVGVEEGLEDSINIKIMTFREYLEKLTDPHSSNSP